MEWGLNRGGWATVGLETVMVRLPESGSSAGCNRESPAMILNEKSVGSASKNIINHRYLSIEGGKGWVVAVGRNAK